MANLMKLTLPNINIPKLEIVIIIVFLLYLILPVETPDQLKPLLKHSMGMIVVLVATLYLFLYSHPILGILALLVAYELMRRSCDNKKIRHVRFNESTEVEKKRVMNKMNPPKARSLEEDVVEKMAPSRVQGDFIASTYKPVVGNTHSALTVSK